MIDSWYELECLDKINKKLNGICIWKLVKKKTIFLFCFNLCCILSKKLWITKFLVISSIPERYARCVSQYLIKIQYQVELMHYDHEYW